MAAEPEDAVPIDVDLIKVLASDTRRDILRLLRQRRMTLTEMSTALDLKKATVLEHLKRLTDAGLVRRMDDGERLWIYYELTRSGRRVVEPGRTRFYLIVGVAFAAGVVGMAALLVFQTISEPPAAEGSGPLLVQLDRSEVFAGSAVSFSAFVEGAHGSASDLTATLVLPEAAALLEAGVEDVPGVPLEVTSQPPVAGLESSAPEAAASSDTASRESGAMAADQRADVAMEDPIESPFVQLSALGPLPPGTYYLYVRDASGRDNREQLVAVHVLPVDVSVVPERWWRGIDGPARFAVAQGGVGLEGTLVLAPVDPPAVRPELSLPLVRGEAELPAATLDTMPSALYGLRLLPADGGPWIELQAWFDVRDASIAILPHEIIEGTPAALQISIGTDALEHPAEAVARAGATELSRATITGSGAVEFQAPGAGTLAVQVGRVFEQAVRVHPDVRLTITSDERGAHGLQVGGPDGAPRKGVGVLLDDGSVGFTAADGSLALPKLARGEHVLRLALAPDGAIVERVLFVEGWDVSEALSSVSMGPPALRPVDNGTIRVGITLDNPSGRAERVTVVATLDGVLAAARPVEIPAGATTETLFAFNTTATGLHRVGVRLEEPALPALTFVNRSAGATSGGSGAGTATGTDESAAPAFGAAGVARAFDEATVEVEVREPDALSQKQFEAEAVASGLAYQREALEDALGNEVFAEGSEATPGFGAIAILGAFAAVALAAGRRRGRR